MYPNLSLSSVFSVLERSTFFSSILDCDHVHAAYALELFEEELRSVIFTRIENVNGSLVVVSILHILISIRICICSDVMRRLNMMK